MRHGDIPAIETAEGRRRALPLFVVSLAVGCCVVPSLLIGLFLTIGIPSPATFRSGRSGERLSQEFAERIQPGSPLSEVRAFVERYGLEKSSEYWPYSPWVPERWVPPPIEASDPWPDRSMINGDDPEFSAWRESNRASKSFASYWIGPGHPPVYGVSLLRAYLQGSGFSLQSLSEGQSPVYFFFDEDERLTNIVCMSSAHMYAIAPDYTVVVFEED